MLKKLFKYETRVAIFYWLFGIIWIYITDYLLKNFIQNPILLTRIQNYKGWFFVTASAFLIYFLFRHYFSEQRQIQQSLQDSEEKFRTVFESANVGKSHTKLTGEISVNQAYADMLGYTREELAHRTWQSLTPPEDVGIVQTHLDELLASGSDSTRYGKRYIHKNGSIINADVSVDNGTILMNITFSVSGREWFHYQCGCQCCHTTRCFWKSIKFYYYYY